LFTISWLSS